MKEILKMVYFVDMEYGNQKMMIHMKDSIEIIKKMEKVHIHGTMV